MAIEIRIHEEPGYNGKMITANIPREAFEDYASKSIYDAFDAIAAKFAEDYIQKNLAEIYSKIDVQAISNIVLLEVTKQVKNNIMEKK